MLFGEIIPGIVCDAKGELLNSEKFLPGVLMNMWSKALDLGERTEKIEECGNCMLCDEDTIDFLCWTAFKEMEEIYRERVVSYG